MKHLIVSLLCLMMSSFCFAQQKTLDDYLQIAVKNSPLLKDLNNQILSAQLDSVRIKAGLKPQVSAGSAGLYAPVIHGYGYSQAITNGQTLDALLSVNKSFISNGYLKAQYNGIGLQRDSLRNNIKLSEQDLRRTIAAQYITAFGSLQQVKFNKEVVTLLSSEEDLLKKLTRNNVYHQSDYLTFLVTLKQATLQLSQVTLQYKTDFATLNYLTGITDTTVAELEKPALQRAITADKTNSIFFRQYALDSLRLLNTRKLIDYSYKPQVKAFADGGYNSDLTALYYKHFGASVGFSLTVPIYDGGQRKVSYKKLALEEESRKNYKSFFAQQYSQQIIQLNQQIDGYDNLIADINTQFKYSETLIKVDTKLLQTGDLRMADLILAINNYLTIRNLLTQNTISRLLLINQLNYWNR
ncbi:TolC family protein [Mucilaginibacter sp. HC2]|uniref:TolC family protein n=1 Tax=Mucilaginibacter inviolabilis TaxID=2714892 RepID=UPI001407E2FE|nr:TolC family protein [Mucilaginibacter inviolabilis]NHA07446.1 TolC family protein [Mucilaginibacter inviolabilis]